MNWSHFFPPATEVLALPTWKAPRLYIPAHTLSQRWRRSRLYPAFRLRARVFRFFLRARAALLPSPVRVAARSDWPLAPFLRDALPSVTSVSVLVGTPGPTQKMIVQCCDRHGEIVGYLKYAERLEARKRLDHEAEIIDHLPSGLGPAPIKYGRWGNGTALLVSPLVGQAVPATLPLPEGIAAFTRRLHTTAPPVALDAHPWLREAKLGEEAEPFLDVLAARTWPVVIQHGDLAPWNVRRRPSGQLVAYDWEYGTLHGFPHLDLMYYILQVAVLIYGWTPAKAIAHAAQYVCQQSSPALSPQEIRALIGLTACDAYRQSCSDAQPSTPLQRWRRAVWEEAACGL